MLPDAHYLYACDPQWWKVHIDKVRAEFSGKLYTQYRTDTEKQAAEDMGIMALKGESNRGLGFDRLHFGGNSGYQAINMAYLMGATRIILLGYDMGNTGGKSHWFGDHPKELTNGRYDAYIPHFTRLAIDLSAEGVEVLNCSRASALTQFNRVALEDVQWAT